jgi:DNA-binding NtrC family response regulator
MSHVLIVDDEPSICWGLTEVLGEDGHEASAVGSAEAALSFPVERRPDVMLLDVRLPGQDGISAIPQLRERFGDVPIVVVTAFGDLSSAVRAIEAGAVEYLCKPLNADEVSTVVGRALSQRATPSAAVAESGRTLADSATELVGASPAMQRVFKQIALAAVSDVPVLVVGESGTGKELIARAIHRHSDRRSEPFTPVALPALNHGLIESELFGHEKGAFTGADTDRKGLLEASAGGTVFLDEIGDAPLDTQVKLLRAIEYHEITPVGGVRPRRVDFRVIAATHRPLSQLVEDGRFREDLFYRLHVFVIEAPPLDDRRDDIPMLANHFLRRSASGRSLQFAEAAMQDLCGRIWPGNVRELRNAVEHAAATTRSSVIDVEHLPKPLPRPSVGDAGVDLARRIREWAAAEASNFAGSSEGGLHARLLATVERPFLEAVLEHCEGNQTTAAALLGLHRSTLRQRLRELGLK